MGDQRQSLAEASASSAKSEPSPKIARAHKATTSKQAFSPFLVMKAKKREEKSGIISQFEKSMLSRCEARKKKVFSPLSVAAFISSKETASERRQTS